MAGAGSNLDQNAPKFFSVAHLNIYNQKQGVLNEYWQNGVFWATLGKHGFRSLRSTLTQLLSHMDSTLSDLEDGANVDTI